MKPLTNNEYNEVCKWYAQQDSAYFDDQFISYEDNSVSYLYNLNYYNGGTK